MATSDLLSASRENGFCKFVPVLSPTSRNLSEWLDHDIPGSSHDSKLLSSEGHVWLRRELGLRNFIQEGSEPSSRKKVPHQDQHKLNAKSSFFCERTRAPKKQRENERPQERETERAKPWEPESKKAGKRESEIGTAVKEEYLQLRKANGLMEKEVQTERISDSPFGHVWSRFHLARSLFPPLLCLLYQNLKNSCILSAPRFAQAGSMHKGGALSARRPI